MNWMRSAVIPPKAIAPIRPLPTGRASVHVPAGCPYHRQSGASAGAEAAAVNGPSNRTAGGGPAGAADTALAEERKSAAAMAGNRVGDRNGERMGVIPIG